MIGSGVNWVAGKVQGIPVITTFAGLAVFCF